MITLTPNDIGDKLEELVRIDFPEEDVHRELLPSGYTRPCTLIVQDGCEGKVDFGTNIVELRPVFTLTTFVTVDEYHHSHLKLLHQRQMKLLAMLLPGYLEIGDRAAKVKKVSLGGNYDYDTVTVEFRYTLDRADVETIAGLPVMQQLHLREEIKTHG